MARPTLTAAMAFATGRAEPLPMTPSRFDAWYAELRAPLRAYLQRVAGSTGAADDLFQETWIRFLAHPPRTDEAAAVRAYVFTVATRLAADAWRRESWFARWIHAPRRRSKDGENDLGAVEAVADPSPAPDGLHEARDEAARALRTLAPRERALLWLAHVERYDHHEIATILRLRPKSIRVLLHRARKKCVAALTESPSGRGGSR